MKTTIKYIGIAVRWFDKVNGNTYHSVRITRIKDNAAIVAPFQYGYGDQYKQSALTAMLCAGWINHPEEALYNFERENNYPIFWDVKDGLKKECVNNGILEASK